MAPSGAEAVEGAGLARTELVGPAVRATPFGALVELSKPKVTRLVLVTTGLGAVAAPGPVEWQAALSALVGTALVVAGANALNMLLEKDSDALMSRTATRPLPTGRLPPDAALLFGLLTSLAGLLVLSAGTTAAAVGIATLALVAYVLVYTPLKRVSSLSLLVGAVPGALPPAIGYAAMTGTLDGIGFWLFAILFVWQVPHFLAISIFRRSEYVRAGLRVLPEECGIAFARTTAFGMALVLLFTSLMPVFLGQASLGYAAIALVTGALFAVLAGKDLGKSQLETAERSAKKLFFASMPHLVILLGALALGAP